MSPVNIDESYIRKLSQSNYLIISQKYDVLCLGMLFLKLLLFFEKMDFNPNNGYNTKIEKQKSYLINKYFSFSVLNEIIFLIVKGTIFFNLALKIDKFRFRTLKYSIFYIIILLF